MPPTTKNKCSDEMGVEGALRYLIASLVIYGNCLQLLAHLKKQVFHPNRTNCSDIYPFNSCDVSSMI